MTRKVRERNQDIEVGLIDEPGGIIRLEIDSEEVESLAQNIHEVGLLQRIVVRAHAGRFEIVAGHRRLLAVRSLGWKRVPCVIRDYSDVDCALARASENLGRVDLSPIEEAATYSDLHSRYGLTWEQIGKKFGKSAGVVKRRTDMLRMPPELQQAIHKKEISMSVGEELWSLGDVAAISYYLQFAVDNGATKDVVRGWVHDWKKAKRVGESAGGEGDPLASPIETRPTYLPCDICRAPYELGKETTIRTCAECAETILRSLRG